MNDLCREHGTTDSAAEVKVLLTQLPSWKQGVDGKVIERKFRFNNFHETVGFVNTIAWIANRQDHHPELEVHYNRCAVRFATHTLAALSRNNFICAARVDGLLE